MCTLLAAQSATGPILGSNSDNPYLIGSRVFASVDEKFPFIGSEVITHLATDPVPWDSVMTRGINARGVAFTYSYVPHTVRGRTVASQKVIDREATRALLGRAESSEDLADLIESRAGVLNDGNYLIADSGGLCVVMVNGDVATRVLPDSSGRVSCTNAWYSSAEPTDENWLQESFSRERLSQAAAIHGIPVLDRSETLTELKAVLSVHDAAGAEQEVLSVEAHGKESGTISSELMVPAALTFWWCYGWPSGIAHGHEENPRESWADYLAFDVRKVDHTGLLTTAGGNVTLYGTRVLAV